MKQLIEDYKRRVETIQVELSDKLCDANVRERLTTKMFEYKAFIGELERLNVQNNNVPEDSIPDIGEQINTVGQLKAFLSTLKDDDLTVMESIDLETGDVEDLFPFHMDVIDGIELTDGRTVSEIRFCQETNVPEGQKYPSKNKLRLSDETPKLVSLIDFTTLRTQKGSLNKTIDEMELAGKDDEAEDLTGILNLIDAIQDFAVDFMGLNPIDIYDFELEEGREDVVKPADRVIKGIIARKKDGIDCTEAESAEIKGYLRELKLPEEQSIVADIQILFPQEYGEYVTEDEKQDGYL